MESYHNLQSRYRRVSSLLCTRWSSRDHLLMRWDWMRETLCWEMRERTIELIRFEHNGSVTIKCKIRWETYPFAEVFDLVVPADSEGIPAFELLMLCGHECGVVLGCRTGREWSHWQITSYWLGLRIYRWSKCTRCWSQTIDAGQLVGRWREGHAWMHANQRGHIDFGRRSCPAWTTGTLLYSVRLECSWHPSRFAGGWIYELCLVSSHGKCRMGMTVLSVSIRCPSDW